MRIEILTKRSIDSVGLYENTARALLELGLEAELKVNKDPRVLEKYKITCGPVLLINGIIRSQEKTLSVEKIKALLKR